MYGEGRNWRYLIGFGLLAVLLIVVIFMIVRGGGKSDAEVEETQKTLTSYTDNGEITIEQTMIGPIVAAQNHYQATTTISNTNATFQVTQGYEGNVINTRTYPMTTTSFGEFLSALDKAGFTNGNTDEKLSNDEGYCAEGNRYIYTIREGDATIQRFWATSCRGVKTYRGNLNVTMNLFQQQIPDYNELTQNTAFTSSFLGL